jgi:hypothetical protein
MIADVDFRNAKIDPWTYTCLILMKGVLMMVTRMRRMRGRSRKRGERQVTI